MHIIRFNIKNFKTFKELTIHFNSDLNILTGANNSGKTTILEAISLWHECFYKLLNQSKSNEKNYRKGYWILGPSNKKYFPFEQINSVRSPFFEDIFHQRDKRNKIRLSATLVNDTFQCEVPFQISSSGSNYVIQLEGYSKYDWKTFNDFFEKLPDAIGVVYASPVASVEMLENFTTDPGIRDSIQRRESFRVIRNRLYKQINSLDADGSIRFLQDLNFILYNNERKIEFWSRSSIQRDKRVLINFKTSSSDTEKDIALLGSGTLQIIEILLNLYQPGEATRELNLILLDEPDSHIHRDIQKRLIDVLVRFADARQLFISTHNEALIRSSDYKHVFHLSGKSTEEIKPISEHSFDKIKPHFKGIYPSPINPAIRSFGQTTGLDFVNAMECDKLIFVEGENDARVFSILLKQQTASRKKYMFWVLGGISEVLENIDAYRTVFTSVRNNKTLWDKSSLIFDRDFMSDEHLASLQASFLERLKLPAFACSSYTFESSLLTDQHRLSDLLAEWCAVHGVKTNSQEILVELASATNNYATTLESRFNDQRIEQTCYLYKNLREKTGIIFNKSIVSQNDVMLQTLVRTNYRTAMENQEYHKLMSKDDVEFIINQVLSKHQLVFSIETDFIELIRLVTKSTWMVEWNFLNSL